MKPSAALGLCLMVAAAACAPDTAQPPAVDDQTATPDATGDRSDIPQFVVDPDWLTLPDDWVLGTSINVSVDRRDHVWIIHRFRQVPDELTDRVAPPVLEFDADGNFVQAWGGPSDAYEWPDLEHGITVDDQDHVWVSGSNPIPSSDSPLSDDMLVKFTTDGTFVAQFGRRDQSGGNQDTENFKRPCEVVVHRATNEAFVADGYGNRRVIVIDPGTGAFKRMWGAFGNTPLDPPPGLATRHHEGPGPDQFGTVHGVKVSNDGLVYVADRNNQRIQVFTLDGEYLEQGFVNRNESADSGPAGGRTVSGIAFSADEAQRFIYVADYSNSHVTIVERETLTVLDSFGARSQAPGDFDGIHNLAVDSRGNLYTAESNPSNRLQKFVLTSTAGVGSDAP